VITRDPLRKLLDKGLGRYVAAQAFGLQAIGLQSRELGVKILQVGQYHVEIAACQERRRDETQPLSCSGNDGYFQDGAPLGSSGSLAYHPIPL
jgi:hypothetical protein